MALSGGHRFGASFGEVFPCGAFAVSAVEQVNDYEKSTRETKVQAYDEKGTGLPVWQLQVMDGDPQVRPQLKTVTVKIDAERCPALPQEPSMQNPVVPIELTGMTVTPYLQKKGEDRQGNPRYGLAHSLRADGVKAPTTKAQDEAAAVSNGSAVKSSTSAGSSASASGKSASSQAGEG